MKILHLFVVFAIMCLSGVARAESFALTDIYYGAGASLNETDDFDDATGYQILAGYNFDYNLGPFSTAVEAGYMDSGDFEYNVNTTAGRAQLITEAKGAWASGHATYPFSDTFEVLGRVGYDFGDDDGALIGAGIGYRFPRYFTLRAEYVARDVTSSLQLNLVYSLDR